MQTIGNENPRTSKNVLAKGSLQPLQSEPSSTSDCDDDCVDPRGNKRTSVSAPLQMNIECRTALDGATNIHRPSQVTHSEPMR